MRITVIVNEEEYARIKKEAGLIPLSAWMKNLAILACNADKDKYGRWEPAWMAAARGRTILEPKKVRK